MAKAAKTCMKMQKLSFFAQNIVEEGGGNQNSAVGEAKYYVGGEIYHITFLEETLYVIHHSNHKNKNLKVELCEFF